MSHTKLAPAFARLGRLTVDELDLGAECRNVWLVVTENKTLRELVMRSPLRHVVYRLRRQSERSDPLELLSKLIVTLAACGYPEATIDLLLVHLNSVKVRCYVGNAHRSLDELDLEETKLEAQENELTLLRRVLGDRTSPEQLQREAEVNELEATLQFERAKELRRLARVRPITRVLDFPRPVVTT